MSRIDLLPRNYRQVCGLPWDRHVAGPQEVWIAVYDKTDEPRLRLGMFDEATRQAGRGWSRLDLADTFADWLHDPEYASFAKANFERRGGEPVRFRAVRRRGVVPNARATKSGTTRPAGCPRATAPAARPAGFR